MYTLKSIARRGTALVAVFALTAATLLPTAPAFADALNPLTERSLLLSSSAPGYVDTDGSGNSNAAPNSIGENYAPAGSGPNGKKTGETFTFKVSSTATVRGFSLQYCDEAAGFCKAPGNNNGDARETPALDPEDPPIPGDRESNEDAHPQGRSDLDFVGTFTEGTTAGTYQVIIDGDTDTGWSITKANLEDDDHSDSLTGKNNYITLTKAAGAAIEAGDVVQIIFRPSETIYITNPGADAFFVKINTYSSDTSLIGNHNDTTPLDTDDHTVIDGGVTVANVMTESIHITTKVLETMAFSVGTRNPDTVNTVSHGICDPIDIVNNNRLNMGNPNAEYSLETDTAYDTHSYWRLSSNSSGGATVYYSGGTLANTVGDSIKAIGTTVGTPTGGKDHSHPGTEQFGLALISPVETWGTGDFDPEWVIPSYDPLTVEADYADGAGDINNADWEQNAEFAFDTESLTTPVVIAQDNDEVINCATAKVRYVANIAASTPAGVYTTKINYLAAPQY